MKGFTQLTLKNMLKSKKRFTPAFTCVALCSPEPGQTDGYTSVTLGVFGKDSLVNRVFSGDAYLHDVSLSDI